MAKTSRSQRREQAQAAAAGATWREKIATLRYVPPLIKLIWQTHRGYTLSMMILRLVRSLVPIATLWAGKLIVDAVFNRDYAVVQGVVLFTATAYIVLNLVADILYVIVNPQIRVH